MAKHEYENRTRNIYRLPRYEALASKPKGRPSKARKRAQTVVLGSVADAHIPEAQRTVRCPSNRVVLTDEQIAAMGERNRRFLEKLVEQGHVTVRLLAA